MPGFHKELADSYHCTGKNNESAEMLVKMFSLIGMPEFAETLKHSFEQGGYDAVVRSQIHLMEHQPPGQYLSVVDLARLYGQLGQREKTLALCWKRDTVSIVPFCSTSRTIAASTSSTTTSATAPSYGR
jgi:hypothetical protein